MFASTKAGGTCFAFPDTCNTPSPSGVTPITYPNIAECSMATGTSETVKMGNMATVHKGSSISSSNGDEAGVSGGVTSGVNMSKCAFKVGVSNIQIEGNDAIDHLQMTGQNGSSSNAVGAQVAPSQTTVMMNMG